ncbi:MAG: M28 family peptidase [Terrimonas sp.]|nr:M28 family peptidase [Terrimonas sp.]
MYKLFFPAVLFLFSTSLISCNNKDHLGDNDGLAAFSADSLGSHIAQLSSDAFEGRKPFSAGETKAINYIREQYQAIGLEPGNGDSYFQEVPMVKITTHAADQMQVKSAKENFTLKGYDDYVIWTDKTDPSISLDQSELIFAGYGIVAPEYNRNDYAGLDVKGKVVLVLVNDPGYPTNDPSYFKGKTMTYYGRWTYKFDEAARQGAKGCLVIHNTDAASYPFSVVQNNWNSAKLRLDTRGKDQPYCDMIGWVSEPAARKLLAAAGKDTSLFLSAAQKDFKPVPLGISISTHIEVQSEYNKTYNVIGKITGSKHPDETIIYTAHWDHLGFGKPDETGDSIYNGALDNASGTAGLLELARGFKSLSAPPERTVIFLSVTAEEQGLWGSAYYTENPIYPLKKTVANINMDGLNWYGKTSDIIVVGEGQNDLEDYLKDFAAKEHRSISFEAHPEAGSYFRSDHFNFAKKGVPALYTGSGINVIGKEKGYGKKKDDEYNAKHYHRPSDEFNDSWILDGAIDDLQLLFKVGKRLAYSEEWPKWKEGSEFKALREQP